MIYQIPIAGHRVTQAMVAALTALEFGERHCPSTPGWVGVSPVLPPFDCPRPRTECVLLGVPMRLDVPSCVPKCANWYPPLGGLNWHTDSGQPGWRVYMYRRKGTWSCGVTSFYYRRGTIERSYQETELMGAYVFEVGPGCWHALDVRDERFSCGLEIPGRMVGELTGGIFLG